MPDPGSRTRRALLPAVALVAPALLGVAVGGMDSRSAWSVAVLWMEPLLLAVGVYGVLWFGWSNRLAAALAGVVGLILGGAAIRRAPVPEAVPEIHVEWAEKLRACALMVDPVETRIRLLTWTLTPRRAPPDVSHLADTNADLYALVGLEDIQIAQRLAARIEGEAISVPGRAGEPGVTLVTRGVFQYCGGSEDRWEMPLGAPNQGQGFVVATFPEIRGVGVVPFLVTQLSTLGPPTAWRGWPDRLTAGSAQLAALTRAIGTKRMVVAGDFGVPKTFRAVSGQLVGAGLTEAAVPASWPARWGPAPGLTLHALDRVWFGDAWRALATHQHTPGRQSRTGIIVDLAAAEEHAR